MAERNEEGRSPAPSISVESIQLRSLLLRPETKRFCVSVGVSASHLKCRSSLAFLHFSEEHKVWSCSRFLSSVRSVSLTSWPPLSMWMWLSQVAKKNLEGFANLFQRFLQVKGPSVEWVKIQRPPEDSVSLAFLCGNEKCSFMTWMAAVFRAWIPAA